MKGALNGLQKLIMDESPSAYYVHCFAHQLQLTPVAVAMGNQDCKCFFLADWAFVDSHCEFLQEVANASSYSRRACY
jgi:hypothetical protein